MNIPIFMSLAALLVSLLTVYFSYLNYKRQRSLENQNLLFKLKIEVYDDFVLQINNLLLFYHEALEKMQDHEDGYKIMTEEEIYDLANIVDDKGFELEMNFSKKQLLLSDIIIEKIEQFYDDFIYNSRDVKLDTVKLDTALDKMYDHADRLIFELRKDLNISNLNKTLNNRTSK